MSPAPPGTAQPGTGERDPSMRAGKLQPGSRRRRLPIPVLILAFAGLALPVLPLLALLPRVNWAGFPAAITSPAALAALSLSVRTGALAVMCCLLFGVPLALLIAQAPPRTAAVLRTLVTLPLVLPPLVGGMALLYLFGRTGYLGHTLDLLGISIPFTFAAVVLAQTFVAMPFLVISLVGSLRAVGTQYEVVAATLGAGRWRILTRVTLPLVAPGLAAGTVLAFARAVGEFGATALVAGNIPGVTQTVPLAIYSAFNGAGVTRESALALSVLLVLVAFVILLLVRDWRRKDLW